MRAPLKTVVQRGNGEPTAPVAEVVVVLPYVGHSVLMQLRDAKAGIACPGRWGFFGGAIHEGETPADTAERELFEELGYRPRALRKLATTRIADLGDVISHAYYCALDVPLERLELQEGMDLGLFSLEEVLTNALFSTRLQQTFPVAETRYIGQTMTRLFRRLRPAATLARETGERRGAGAAARSR